MNDETQTPETTPTSGGPPSPVDPQGGQGRPAAAEGPQNAGEASSGTILSDPATTPSPTDPETEQNPAESAPHNDDDDNDHPALRKARREAKNLRDRLTAAEAERDQLRDRLTAAHRRDAERAAAGRLAQPSDLWTIGGVAPDDVLDDDGNVNTAAVATAAEALVAARPGLAAPAPKYPDMGAGARGPLPKPAPDWTDVLRRRELH